MYNNSDELVIILNAVESTCAVEFYTVVDTSRSPVHNTSCPLHWVCDNVCLNTCMKIQGPWFQRNYIIARDQKSDLHGTSFQSSPKINRMLITRPFAYNESLQHPTIAVLLIKILFFPTTSKVINAFKRWPTHLEKALNLTFPKHAWPEHVTSFYTVGVNIKIVLSPKDEELASSKKLTQFKTRVHKP